MIPARPLRALAAILSLFAAGVHAALAVADLIPGEPTAGLLFGLMALGYLACAAMILRGSSVLDGLVVFYAIGLVLAYVTSRGELPIEVFGVATKIAETLLALIAGALLIAPRGATVDSE